MPDAVTPYSNQWGPGGANYSDWQGNAWASTSPAVTLDQRQGGGDRKLSSPWSVDFACGKVKVLISGGIPKVIQRIVNESDCDIRVGCSAPYGDELQLTKDVLLKARQSVDNFQVPDGTTKLVAWCEGDCTKPVRVTLYGIPVA